MSVAGKSVLFLLRRCLGPVTAIRTRTRALSGYSGFLQQPTWTSSTRSGYVQNLCRTRSILGSIPHNLCTKAPCEEDYPPLPAYESETSPEKKEFNIIQVRGLMWSSTAQDLLQFFSECHICNGESGIHIMLDSQGRSTGQAFIEMERKDDVRKALEMHRHYLGHRYVEVFELTNAEAEEILQKSIQTDTRVVRLRGLPFSSTVDDVVHFFEGLQIKDDGVTIVQDRRGRNSGEAFVWFSKQEDADEALQRHRDVIGNRYIEVFPSSSSEIYTSSINRAPVKSRSRDTFVTQSSSRSGPLPQHYIHMRGLPFRSSAEDIVKFFYPLLLFKILIEYGADGRSTGEADVYFSSHQHALDAMSRDREKIGERYIELFLNSEGDGNTR